MRTLNWNSVVVIGTILALGIFIPLLLGVSRQFERSNFRLTLAGFSCLIASGLHEFVTILSMAQFLATCSTSLFVFGIALLFKAIRIEGQAPPSVRLALPLALLHLVLVFSAFFLVPAHLKALRTVLFSLALMLFSLPLSLFTLRSGPERFRPFGILAGLMILPNLYRLWLALSNLFVPGFLSAHGRQDVWSYLIILALGAGLVAAFGAALIHGGSRVPGAAARDLSLAGLSPAELSYVQSLLEGRSVRDIALAEGVSESTVRNSLARAYRKLGVRDRVDLALRHGGKTVA